MVHNDIVSSLIAVQMGGTGGISSDMIEIFLKQPVMFSVNLMKRFILCIIIFSSHFITCV